jgi:AAA family ATP:ADP antiporter
MRFFDVRPGERRNAATAFLILFGLMASHALLETARDSLFLAKLPATRLPIVYLLVAAVALAISEAQQRMRGGPPGRRHMAMWLGGVGLVNVGFWFLLPRTGEWCLYALYVWSGVVSTLLVIRFWLLAGDLFTVTQAKRLFAFVGTGSILGAIGGSALAQMVVSGGNAEDLLPAAALVLALTAAAPALLDVPNSSAGQLRLVDEARPDLRATLTAIRRHPYVNRIGALVLVSTITFTVVDYVFKAAVADSVEPHQLGYVFATTYLILNTLSLLAQLLLVGWVTRVLAVDRMLSLVPALLAIAGGAVAAGGGVIAALIVKGVDGTFRHSLHRTATEVLYVPLPSEWRSRAKSVIDVVGQRGGQALASLVLLGLAALGADPMVLGGLVVALAVVWIVVAFGLKQPYFDVFRDTLDDRSIRRRFDFPDLDLSSLESLMEALNSPHDNEVLGAMDLLCEKGRSHLVPPLILYHPSPTVVVRALELMHENGRTDHLRLLERLMAHEDASVRSAAILIAPADEENAPRFEKALGDESPDVRAAAIVGLMSTGRELHPRVPSILDTLVMAGSTEAKRSLANAIGARPSPRFDGVLRSLATHPDGSVGRAVARAMRAEPKPAYLPSLISLLERRATREETRRTLVELGEPALHALSEALETETRPTVRLHLPRTISRFDPDAAAPVLMRRLPEEVEGRVRYKLLRALGAVRSRKPGVRLDPAVLDEMIDRTMGRILQAIEWHTVLERQETRHPEWKTPVRGMLRDLVRDKENQAIERLFRLFGLRYPREDFQRIHRGVESGDRAAVASSRELLENALPARLRDAVLGLLDDVPGERRLAAGTRWHRPRRRDDADVFRALLDEDSPQLSCLVAYHVAETGLQEMRADLQEKCDRAVDAMNEVFARAIARLDNPDTERAFVVPLG